MVFNTGMLIGYLCLNNNKIMKKLAIIFALSIWAFVPQTSNAQISVNFNVGAQPLWGPVGYDRVDYYYLPDIETYYYVPNKQFIYLNNGQWAFSNSLPSRYQSYNLYNGYKVVVNRPKPYLTFKGDKVKYAKYKTVKSQPVIKYSKDPKYKNIHANSNGIPPGQAKKIVANSNQRIVVAGSNGKGDDKNVNKGASGKGNSHGKGK